MDRVLEDAKKLYLSELAKLVDKHDIAQSNIDWHFKLIDMIKDICKIECKEQEMYEDDYSGRRGYHMGYSRSYPYPNYMGEYTVEGTYGRGYSRSSPMHAKLQKLMDETDNDHERSMIRAWMNELNS